MNITTLDKIVDLTEENHRLFAETADLKAKLLDTQVQLDRAEKHIRAQADIHLRTRSDFMDALDRLEAAEAVDQVIEVHHFHHIAEAE